MHVEECGGFRLGYSEDCVMVLFLNINKHRRIFKECLTILGVVPVLNVPVSTSTRPGRIALLSWSAFAGPVVETGGIGSEAGTLGDVKSYSQPAQG